MVDKVLDPQWIGWVAGVLDSRATLFVRKVASGTELASVTLTVAVDRRAVVSRLCELTGVSLVTTTKDYSRASCSEHCPTQHIHIRADYARWSVTGIRAIAVLRSCLPYLTVRHDEAEEILAACSSAPLKPATKLKMRALGWAC